MLVGRVHRRLLDIIEDEFARHGRSDVNAVQALLLFNIGDQELSVSELHTRGGYTGTNVSYNVKKLIELGLISHQKSRVDRRSVRIRLTDEGRRVHDIVAAIYARQLATIEAIGGVSADQLETLNRTLQRLDRFWNDQILYRL